MERISKMKLKILQLKSEEYPDGRIDSYRVKYDDESHKILIPLFLDLGFKQDEVLEKLARIFEEGESLFVYGSSDTKAYIKTSIDELELIFDTSINKEKLNKVLEKYLDFPKWK